MVLMFAGSDSATVRSSKSNSSLASSRAVWKMPYPAVNAETARPAINHPSSQRRIDVIRIA